MIRYLLRKVIYMLISLYLLATATFFLMKAVPGDPFTSKKKVPPEILANLKAYYGLDKPIFVQYLHYLEKMATLNFGMSMKIPHMTVNQIILGAFPYSLQIGLLALLVAIIVGVGLGTIAALKHEKLMDNIAMTIAVLGVSIPNFVLAALLQYALGVKIHIFNVAGLNGPMDYVLPTLSLAALPIAFIARLTRSSMLEVLASDYIKTAKAKGMSWRVIINRHALRNAILPVVSYLGYLTANIITGSIVVEQIFGIPGLGKWFIQSVEARDYTLIMGVTMFYAVILMISRFLADIAYVYVDPRIKLISGKEEA